MLSSPPTFPSQGHLKKVDLLNDLAYSNQQGISVDSTCDIQLRPSFSSQSSYASPATDHVAKYNKLRKARPDGYESDGGYISDRASSKKEKKSKKKDKDRTGGYASEGDACAGKKKKKDKALRDTSHDGDESEGGSLS